MSAYYNTLKKLKLKKEALRKLQAGGNVPPSPQQAEMQAQPQAQQMPAPSQPATPPSPENAGGQAAQDPTAMLKELGEKYAKEQDQETAVKIAEIVLTMLKIPFVKKAPKIDIKERYSPQDGAGMSNADKFNKYNR